MKRIIVIIFAIAGILLLPGCSTPKNDPASKNDPTPTAVTFESAVQTGGTSGTTDSTGLTLIFSVDPTTLTSDEITVTGATRGALSGTGTTRSLAISVITVGNGETVSVAIASPSGYSISGSPQTAVVYKDTRVVNNPDFNVDISGWEVDAGAGADITLEPTGETGSALSLNFGKSYPYECRFSSIDNVKSPGTYTKLSFYLKANLISKDLSHVVVKLGDNTYYNIGGNISSDLSVDASINDYSEDYTVCNTNNSFQKITLNGIDQVTNLTSNDFEVYSNAETDIDSVYIDELKFEP